MRFLSNKKNIVILLLALLLGISYCSNRYVSYLKDRYHRLYYSSVSQPIEVLGMNIKVLKKEVDTVLQSGQVSLSEAVELRTVAELILYEHNENLFHYNTYIHYSQYEDKPGPVQKNNMFEQIQIYFNSLQQKVNGDADHKLVLGKEDLDSFKAISEACTEIQKIYKSYGNLLELKRKIIEENEGIVVVNSIIEVSNSHDLRKVLQIKGE